MSGDWIWDEIDPGKPTMSGDIAKMFRHEEQKAPGIFGLDAPPAPAVLLAREVIQNSWDAARELAEEGGVVPQFSIQFRFRAYVGDEKASMVQALGLNELARRAEQLNRAEVGLSEANCFDTLTDLQEPLRLLEILEHGASGMYGPWKQSESQMYLALLSLGFTEKKKGAGGSYGYGKAGLISGSRIRNVIAYTCFRERQDDPGITRRLLGMTYWGQHSIGDTRFTGFASLSAGEPGFIKPFVNAEADAIAANLSIGPRAASVPEQLGTTFMLPDPTIDPADLVKAIERFWWPALVEGDFVVEVVDYDETRIHPRPKRDETLRSFIDAWELASGTRTQGPDERRTQFSGITGVGSAGVLGLVADLEGWSYADEMLGPDEEPVEHKSLVALTRGPRMVVEYFVAGHTRPYIRGVFVADPSVDNDLRLTEPKAHDSWQTKSDDGELNSDAAAVANHVITKIKQTVANHRTKLKPPAPPPEQIDLPTFNEIMKRVMSGAGRTPPPPPPPETRQVSIHLDYRPEPVADEVRISGSASFALTDLYAGDSASVRLSVSYRFLEDDRVGEHAALVFEAPEGLTSVGDGIYEGVLHKGHEVRLGFQSKPYDPSWSGKLIVNGEVVGNDGELAGA